MPLRLLNPQGEFILTIGWYEPKGKGGPKRVRLQFLARCELDLACSARNLSILAVRNQLFDDRRVGESRDIAEIGKIIFGDFAQDAAHDLT